VSYVYSTQFIAWSDETNPPAFEVPTGYVLVLRDIDVVSGGGSIINWEAGATPGSKIAGGQFTVESIIQHQQWRGRQVFNAGEFIYFASDGATDGRVSGYLLADVG
jgi:hypothetical protein